MQKRMRSLVTGSAVAVALQLTGCGPVDDAQAPVTEPEVESQVSAALTAGQSHVPGELLVQFEAGLSEEARGLARARISASRKELIHTAAMRAAGAGPLELLTLPAGLSVAEARRGIAGAAGVRFAEPNFVYTHGATSTDTYYTNGSLWGMYGDATSPANQYGSQAGEAWAAGHTGSSNIVVGIIDEGFQADHVDLVNNIWVNPYDPVDGVDNDGNGYVDDTNGWDFVNNDHTVYDGGSRGSLDKHGTHVAGTIGAQSNGTGVVGVNWNVKMISGKFLGRNGGTTANAIKAVDYMTDLKTRHGMDLVATNNSWGGGGFSQALADAIERANQANILFIAAAGNGGSDGVGDDNDATPSYPASYANSNVIAVAALTSSGARASYSNFGATSVDLGAPGSGIYSTLPYNTYGSYSGTSMATPHVTGGAALRAAHSTSRGAALKADILNSTVPTASMSGKCVTGGRLNVSGF